MMTGPLSQTEVDQLLQLIETTKRLVINLTAAAQLSKAFSDRDLEGRVRDTYKAVYRMCERFCVITKTNMKDLGIGYSLDVLDGWTT